MSQRHASIWAASTSSRPAGPVRLTHSPSSRSPVCQFIQSPSSHPQCPDSAALAPPLPRPVRLTPPSRVQAQPLKRGRHRHVRVQGQRQQQQQKRKKNRKINPFPSNNLPYTPSPCPIPSRPVPAPRRGPRGGDTAFSPPPSVRPSSPSLCNADFYPPPYVCALSRPLFLPPSPHLSLSLHTVNE